MGITAGGVDRGGVEMVQQRVVEGERKGNEVEEGERDRGG